MTQYIFVPAGPGVHFLKVLWFFYQETDYLGTIFHFYNSDDEEESDDKEDEAVSARRRILRRIVSSKASQEER